MFVGTRATGSQVSLSGPSVCLQLQPVLKSCTINSCAIVLLEPRIDVSENWCMCEMPYIGRGVIITFSGTELNSSEDRVRPSTGTFQVSSSSERIARLRTSDVSVLN